MYFQKANATFLLVNVRKLFYILSTENTYIQIYKYILTIHICLTLYAPNYEFMKVTSSAVAIVDF